MRPLAAVDANGKDALLEALFRAATVCMQPNES